jgi:phosphatidylserine decarboxylase
VVLAEPPLGLLFGLPNEDQQAIFQIVGKPVRLNKYDKGRAELEVTDDEGVLHLIYVSPDLARSP